MDLKPLLAQLDAISDEELRSGLRQENISISTDKYTTAFSCIAIAYNLRCFDFEVRTAPPDIPSEHLRQQRQRASIVFMAFTALQYMRSEHLERGLDHVAESSPLRPFRDIFRTGSTKQGDDTYTQHMRNALAHGTFEVSQHKLEVIFQDRSWKDAISFDDLWSLCGHVHRLYHAAFFLNERDSLPEWPKISKNPILDELHAVREKLLTEAGGTIEGLMAKLRADQAKTGRAVINSVDELPKSPNGETRVSIATAFGTPPVQRSGPELLAESRAERDSWGER